jgi:multiple sugar transport system substrate-binding protein
MAAVLASCASSGTPGSSAPAASEPQGTIVWSARVNADENRWQQELVLRAMRQKFPKINVTLETGDANTWAEKLIALYAADSPPDVHVGFAGIFMSLYAQGKALELTPYIKRDKVDLSLFGGLQNAPDMCRSGKTYELPVDSGAGFMLFYNQAMLQQAGLPTPPTSWQVKSWTWDVALDMMRKTTKDYGEANAIYGLFSPIADPWFQIFPNMWGGDPWPKDFYAKGVAQASNWTSAEVVQSIQYIQDLALKHRVMPAQGMTPKAFAMGGTAFWLMGVRGGVGQLNAAQFPWGIAPMPRQVTNATASFNNGIMANKGTKVPEAAWQLIKYMTSQEANVERAKLVLAPPTRVDAFDPWLDAVLPKTIFKTKAQLKEVTTGYLSAVRNSWSGAAMDAAKLLGPVNDLRPNLMAGKGTAATLLVDVKNQIDAQLRSTYETYKSSQLANDALCS